VQRFTQTTYTVTIEDAQNWVLYQGSQKVLTASGGILNDNNADDAPITGTPSEELSSYAACFPNEPAEAELGALASQLELAGW